MSYDDKNPPGYNWTKADTARFHMLMRRIHWQERWLGRWGTKALYLIELGLYRLGYNTRCAACSNYSFTRWLCRWCKPKRGDSTFYQEYD